MNPRVLALFALLSPLLATFLPAPAAAAPDNAGKTG